MYKCYSNDHINCYFQSAYSNHEVLWQYKRLHIMLRQHKSDYDKIIIVHSFQFCILHAHYCRWWDWAPINSPCDFVIEITVFNNATYYLIEDKVYIAFYYHIQLMPDFETHISGNMYYLLSMTVCALHYDCRAYSLCLCYSCFNAIRKLTVIDYQYL